MSSGDRQPQPWEFSADLFPHSISFRAVDLKLALEKALLNCRSYVVVALPSLSRDGTYHIVHFRQDGESFAVQYSACLPDSHDDA